MIELSSTKPTSTSVGWAVVSAAIIAGHFQTSGQELPYPVNDKPYEIQQLRGTNSNFLENIAFQQQSAEAFAQQVAVLYDAFAKRQEPLGVEFEVAIFSDLDGLYEA